MTEEVMAQEMAQMEAEWQRKYDLSAIPNRLRTSSLKAVSDKFEYKAKVRNFGKMLVSRESPYGLFMYGPYRSGKTSLAAGLAMYAVRHNIHVYYAKHTKLFDTKINNPQWHPEVESGVWDWMKKVRLLVIDDLFRNSENKYGRLNATTLEDLLEERMDNGLLHIFTSNTYPEDLESTLDARTARLIEQSCYSLEIKGMDYSEAIAKRRLTL